MSKPKRITVTWLDAATDDDSWWDKTTLPAHKDHVCESPGILVRETKNYVYVAQTFDPVDDSDFTNIIAIPRGCIIKPKRLK